MIKEIELQQGYHGQETIQTIYFGGGTPSLLSGSELNSLVSKIRSHYTLSPDAEITLEANPDDITDEKCLEWKEAGINRLSIGIQSFFDEDLLWMNRAHTAQQAKDNLQLAMQHFENITIDLIYGTPMLTSERWKQNIELAVSLGIPHLSCYALTVETKTPLYKMIRQEETEDVDPDKQSEQFSQLMQWMEDSGYEHYEISNFSKPGFRSRHNSSYWEGKKYLGIGPSAHSFNEKSRQWNVSNNTQYIESVNSGNLFFEKEDLTAIQKLNEYIMTALRTSEGVNLARVEPLQAERLRKESQQYIQSGKMLEENNFLKLTREGKLLADGIASGLFF